MYIFVIIRLHPKFSHTFAYETGIIKWQFTHAKKYSWRNFQSSLFDYIEEGSFTAQLTLVMETAVHHYIF